VSELLGPTVAELVSGLRARGKKVPAEVGAFLTLQAVERILDRPAVLGPEAVRVTDDGAVSVFSPAGQASPAEVTKSASALLAHLLLGAGAAVPPALLELVERGPSDGSQSLPRFRDELEASLLPLNRGASRRTLARLVRETRAGAGASSQPPGVDAGALDADLDALLGAPAPRDLSAEPPRAVAARTAALDADLDALLDGAERGAGVPRPMQQVERAPSASLSPAPSTLTSPSLSPSLSPAPVPRPGEAELDPARAESRKGLYVALFFVALVAGTAAVVGALRPDVLRRMMGEAPPEVDHRAEEAAALAAAEQRAADEAAERYGDLVIHVEPARSQVLLRVGRGPAVAQNLPVGVAHEFVAIAEGRAPTRAVVPPDATWEPTEQGPRYELAMQAGEAPMPFEALELGPTRLPREAGAHRGQLGAVRVLTNPPGAEVYLLIGFSPDVRVRDLRADATYELLAFREGHVPARVTVRPEDFRPGEGGADGARAGADSKRVAEVRLRLEPRGRRGR
jgi:hypothetical protein